MYNNTQLDMFHEVLPPEIKNMEKLALLEHQQNKLRQGLFKRFGEHEKKFSEISDLLGKVLQILVCDYKHE